MKTKEELNVIIEEVEALNKKLAELSEEELLQVSGGAQKTNWEEGDQILLHFGGGQSQLDKYIKILAGNEKKLVDTGPGTKLELNPTIKYEEDGNVQIILRDKPDA